ncbi:MAG: hypothetical protein JGK21_11405 [Microcoleus sp. PH2017_22_RUC_O_B]|uniref:hypothetical protein n=1 Tax=unclassified Microcoleus TaxID=2642155 RepID=UPI001DB3553B|nr:MULTISPECIES: hypothetical protein [unclassified Microcoleus]MCC3528790.1 hypothetical protein [Microcoleus sp. PH2017_21_RUC_O_A]MCC3540968.1 hypothetical protein [Microcoleus sp. PH2017_22_RUC_O_B]
MSCDWAVIPQYGRRGRSTFLVYPIAGVGRSIECDRLPVLIFGVISMVNLMDWGLGAIDRP